VAAKNATTNRYFAGRRCEASLRTPRSRSAPEDWGMEVVGAFIGVDRLEVHHVADQVILVGDAIAEMHVAGSAGDVEAFSGIL
jgi:hypothetical protein